MRERGQHKSNAQTKSKIIRINPLSMQKVYIFQQSGLIQIENAIMR